jgi:GWxTD domain-containing protein
MITSSKGIILLLFSLICQNTAAIDAQFRYCTFQQPGKSPYIETYLSINSRSLAFVKVGPNSFQGAIEVTIDFSRNDTIVAYDKYTLRSPVIDSTTNNNFAFLDLQRFRLSAGTYKMQLQIVDKADTSNHATAKEEIVVEQKGGFSFSDIMLVNKINPASKPSPLTRGGLDLEPRPSAFFGNGQDTLSYYFELYGANQLAPDSLVILRSWVEKVDGDIVPNTSRFYKRNPKDIIAIADAFLIDEVPSGNYKIQLEARNRENELIASKSYLIQRLNTQMKFDESKVLAAQFGGSFVDKLTRAELMDNIRSMRPISQFMEREYADNLLNNKEVDDELLKRYMLTFWEKRDATSPRAAWELYSQQVNNANQLFSSKITKGYETDRGRVYLQYGAPNSRTVVDNEPSAYPYEIWWYYEYQGQRNIRFVFYNPDMVTNDYQLLHSEALGETFDPQWRLIIFSRTTAFQNLDDTQNRDHFGTRLEENFRNQ